MQGTPILITINERARTLKYDMQPAVRDTIALRIQGLSKYVMLTGVENQYRGVTLTLKSREGKKLNAVPPVSIWQIDGEDILAHVVLLSSELDKIFKYVSPKGTRTLDMFVDLDSPPRLLGKGDFILCNNPAKDGVNETHPSPTVAQLLVALREDMETLGALLQSHGHDGVATLLLRHGDLQDVGALTHTQIDKALEYSYPVNLRILNALKKHNREWSSHNTRFTAVDDAHKNHIESDASKGNNVHGIIEAINALVAAHETSPLSHADLRALLAALPTLVDVAEAIAKHDTNTTAHGGLRAALEEVRNIALGASVAYAFNDEAELLALLAVPANRGKLKVGNALYTVKRDDFDFWWDGNTLQPLQEKINLAGYATVTWVEQKLAEKVDKEEGKGLSEQNFTLVEKTKLATIPEGGETLMSVTGREDKADSVRVKRTYIDETTRKVVFDAGSALFVGGGVTLTLDLQGDRFECPPGGPGGYYKVIIAKGRNALAGFMTLFGDSFEFPVNESAPDDEWLALFIQGGAAYMSRSGLTGMVPWGEMINGAAPPVQWPVAWHTNLFEIPGMPSPPPSWMPAAGMTAKIQHTISFSGIITHEVADVVITYEPVATDGDIAAHNDDADAHKNLREAMTTAQDAANVARIAEHNNNPAAHPEMSQQIGGRIHKHNTSPRAHQDIRKALTDVECVAVSAANSAREAGEVATSAADLAALAAVSGVYDDIRRIIGLSVFTDVPTLQSEIHSLV